MAVDWLSVFSGSRAAAAEIVLVEEAYVDIAAFGRRRG
jgi:hypothetical protein